jgi:hypothetical protein
MHTVAGMAPRLGTWRDELQAVLEGVLPTGRLAERGGAPTEADAMRQAIVSCLHQGLAAGLTVDADGEVAGRVAIPDRVAATVDLDALAHDYRAWLAAAGVPGADEEFEQIDWAVEQLRSERACYSDFLWDLAFEARGSEPVMPAMITGIVWGDDPATTCALLLKELTGDQRLWESPR